jgi:protein phosphatase PTC7
MQSFNCPLQLAFIPKLILERARKFGGNPFIDSPDDAAVSSHALRHGDVVLFATDGVWDNLTNQQILRTASAVMINGGAWEIRGQDGIVPTPALMQSAAEDKIHVSVAEAIVSTAKSASLNAKVDGPFAKEVQRLFPNENWHGGKKDDICVLCAVVIEEVI